MTLFEIVDATADSGAIVGQVVVEIDADDTAETLFRRISVAHVELIREYVPQLLARSGPRLPQGSSRASSWPKRTPRRNHRLGDVRRTCTTGFERRRARIRERSTFLGGEKVVVWRARPVDDVDAVAPAGTIVAARPEGPVVAGEAHSCSKKSRREQTSWP